MTKTAEKIAVDLNNLQLCRMDFLFPRQFFTLNKDFGGGPEVNLNANDMQNTNNSLLPHINMWGNN